MYETFFQLRERPFAAAPITRRYFPATAIEMAHKTLLRCIERAEGAGLVVGPSGTGKTLLLQLLAGDLRGRFSTAVLTSGQLGTRRALLQAILYELSLPYRGMEEGELRLMLVDHLSPAKATTQGLVLLVDEAHTLPFRLLEELRMITNLVRDGQPRVRLVLCGSPLLEEHFASPKLDSFSQRLAARCYLEPLNREDTAAYVVSQITSVGGSAAQVFGEDALESVHRATDGIPRLINQVCDHSLILAGLGHCRPVTGAVIEEAWADLQQLPAPWNLGAEAKSGAAQVVEFGGLENRSEETPEAIPFHGKTKKRTQALNPEEQLDQIQEQVAELEEEFRPAGSIGPEVELDFGGASDPFGEQFEEEEVVIDRYSSLESDLFHDRPVVESREGRELSALLAPLVVKPAEPTISLGKTPVKSPALVAAPSGSEFDGRTDESVRAMMAPQATFGGLDDGEDDDLIIVEDETPIVTAPVRPALVRRQEYRQLFAKLRRG